MFWFSIKMEILQLSLAFSLAQKPLTSSPTHPYALAISRNDSISLFMNNNVTFINSLFCAVSCPTADSSFRSVSYQLTAYFTKIYIVLKYESHTIHM